jgi:hypothetical protein
MAQDKSGARITATVERRPAAVTPVQRSAAPTRSPAQSIQQRLGHQAIQALIARTPAPPEPASRGPPVADRVSAPTIQRAAVAHVSSPHDPAEREAEETARKVVQMPHSGPAVPTKDAQSGTVQRDAATPSSVVTPTGVNLSGGAPLPASVRSYMEPRFQADFGHVRVHHDRPAAEQSAQLGAHAFTVGNHVFFGDGKYQPESDGGRELIAHELTHTIQQGAAIQRSVDATTVQRSVDTSVTQRTVPMVQRLGLSDALNWVANKANLIPGFRLLTIVLGVNPVNMSPVDRSAANILRALLELIPITGALLSQALDNYGIFAKVGAWIEIQIKSLGLVGAALKAALGKFLDSLGLGDLLDLGGVWERGKLIFTEPIDKLINFGKSLANDIIKFIRDAILMPLAKLAEGTKGWDLLIAVLGQNPITGEPVKRDAEHLIGGFMKLIGQEEIWQNLQKSHAVPRAWAWFQGALEGLMGFVRQIPGLFMTALHSIELIDIVILPKAFAKVAGVFGGFFVQFFTWAGHTIWTLLEIIFEVVSPATLTYLKKTGAALKGILMNPLPFMGNLVKAAKLGLNNFAEHFWDHLKAGLIDWLTGSLPGIYIPRAFTLQEIVKFVFSVLGLSWANVRAKLVKVVGETAVKVMETGFDIVVTLVTQGPAAAWDKIKEQLSNLKDMVIDGIISFIVDLVVKKAIPKLVAMFIPGAGFISAIVSIYDTIMVFVQKISKIIAVVKSFVDSIVDIANGAIDGAAKRVETTLAGLLSLAISFFAGFAGLADVAKPVMDVIHKVWGVIDKALDSLIDWIVKTAKSLFAKAFGKKDERTEEEKKADLEKALAEAEAVKSKPDATEASIKKELPQIQKKYRLDSLVVVVDSEDPASETIHIEGSMSPAKKGPPGKIKKQVKKEMTIVRETGSLGGSTVGLSMTVDWLNDKHPEGSPSSSSEQVELMNQLVTEPKKSSADKFIRGHLLNEHLGGPGVALNMFPITANANKNHLTSTESPVKKWVVEPDRWVWYQVKATNISSKLNGKAKSPQNYVDCAFICEAVQKTADGEVKDKLSTTIPSTYQEKQTKETTDNFRTPDAP